MIVIGSLLIKGILLANRGLCWLPLESAGFGRGLCVAVCGLTACRGMIAAYDGGAVVGRAQASLERV